MKKLISDLLKEGCIIILLILQILLTHNKGVWTLVMTILNVVMVVMLFASLGFEIAFRKERDSKK